MHVTSVGSYDPVGILPTQDTRTVYYYYYIFFFTHVCTLPEKVAHSD